MRLRPAHISGEKGGASLGTSHGSDRIFVPLVTEAFDWFKSGEKEWELRGYGGQWTEKHLRPGRRVELRKGYSSPDRIWGKLTEVVAADSIQEMYDKVPFKKVVPVAKTKAEAIQIANHIMGKKERYIAFRVSIQGQ